MDRFNTLKRHKPIAANKISTNQGITFSLFLLFVTILLLLTFKLKVNSIVIILLYFSLNLAYSFSLKNVPILELFIVSSGFLFRMLLGFSEGNIEISFWMLSITFFGSLLLIIGKRKTELYMTFSNSGSQQEYLRPVLKEYTHQFFDILIGILLSNIMISYLIYLVNSKYTLKYGSVTFITLFPIIYGLIRYVQLLYVYGVRKDPTSLILQDKSLVFTIMIWLLMFTFIFMDKFNF